MNKQINELKIFLISFDLTTSETSTKILRTLSHIGLRKDNNILIILFSASDSLMSLIKIIVLLRYHTK